MSFSTRDRPGGRSLTLAAAGALALTFLPLTPGCAAGGPNAHDVGRLVSPPAPPSTPEVSTWQTFHTEACGGFTAGFPAEVIEDHRGPHSTFDSRLDEAHHFGLGCFERGFDEDEQRALREAVDRRAAERARTLQARGHFTIELQRQVQSGGHPGAIVYARLATDKGAVLVTEAIYARGGMELDVTTTSLDTPRARHYLEIFYASIKL